MPSDSLIIFTSQNHVMSVAINPIKADKPVEQSAEVIAATERLAANESGVTPIWKKRSIKSLARIANPFRRRGDPDGFVSFANAPITIYLCWGELRILPASES